MFGDAIRVVLAHSCFMLVNVGARMHRPSSWFCRIAVVYNRGRHCERRVAASRGPVSPWLTNLRSSAHKLSTVKSFSRAMRAAAPKPTASNASVVAVIGPAF